MPFTVYQASIPVFLHSLGQLSKILDKAANHAETLKFDPSILLSARLAPDMYPLSRQIQVASDTAKGAGARLAGVEVPSFPDNETSFAELQERIAKTAAFLRGLDPTAFEGAAEREVILKFPNGEMKFAGAEYLSYFALPNFYFHAVTAYDILRHNGVAIGKMDFMGGR